MTEISFDKYAIKGAYHWSECFGAIHRLNAYTMGRYEVVLSALRDHGMASHTRILDVGCGDGALTGLISIRTNAEVHGIDTTPLSIELAQSEFAKRRLAGNFQVVDGYSYPFQAAQFSAVVCSDVIEHVQQPDTMLLEMWRVLAPGGLLVVTTPVRFTEAPLDRMHVQEWFPDSFRSYCAGVLGVPVNLELSHPVALAELYASSSPAIGRTTRLIFNLLARFGRNPFLRREGFRAFSTQTIVAVKP